MNRKKKQTSTYTGGLIAKIALTCSVSWQLAKLLGSAHPYLAPLSVILCMKSTVPQSLQFSIHRLVGTVLGVAIMGIVSNFVNKPNFWILGLLIFAGLWIAKGLRRNPIVLEQVALTILLVLVFEHKSGNYNVDRLRDTGIGILLTVLAQLYIPPINYKKEIKKVVTPFAYQLSDLYKRSADWVLRGCSNENRERLTQEIQQFHGVQHHTEQTLKELNKSLKYYPFSAQKQGLVAGYQEQFQHWRHGLAYLDGTVSTIAKWHAFGHMSAADRTIWSRQLEDIGSYFHDHAKALDNTRENKAMKPDYVFVDPIPLHVCLPEHIDPHPYNIALYQDTLELVQQLK